MRDKRSMSKDWPMELLDQTAKKELKMTESTKMTEKLLSTGKVEISSDTPASCITATTCTSYDLEDIEEYADVVGREVTLEEFLTATTEPNSEIAE